jgi:predicted nucleotidyltransferase
MGNNMAIQATVFKLGEQPVHFERGTPAQNWALLERIRTEPLLNALSNRANASRQVTQQPEVSMNEKFLEMLRAFSHHEVKAVLIGAYALAAHGHVRATKDIDFWVEASQENAARVVKALQDFGAEGAYSSEKLSQEDNIVHLTGADWAIDIFTGVRWPKFAPCFERAETVDFGGVTLKVVTIEDLIAMKRFAARPQDLADVSMLELKLAQDKAREVE